MLLSTTARCLNAYGGENLRGTAVYEYTNPENVAMGTSSKWADATRSIDFAVILIPEIATSVNALS